MVEGAGDGFLEGGGRCAVVGFIGFRPRDWPMMGDSCGCRDAKELWLRLEF